MSTPAPDATPSSYSRLQLAHRRSAASDAADQHAQALVKASQNTTTAGGRSLDRQVILEEDDYSEALDRIIKRDFFPELARLDATNEYLAAVEAMDEERLEASVRKLWDIEGETGETPRFPEGNAADTPVPFTKSRKRPIPSSASTIARASHLPTLDRFQAKFTSEDNASFTSILSAENAQRKKELGWAYEQEAVVRQRVREGEEKWRRLLQGAPRSEEERRLMVQGVEERERLRITGASSADPKGKGKAREAIAPAASSHQSSDASSSSSMALITMDPSFPSRQPLSPALPPTDLPLPPDSHLAVALRSAGLPETRTDNAAVQAHKDRGLAVAARTQKEETSAAVEAWPWKTRNSLMFPPDADISQHTPNPFNPVLPTQLPKRITHDNTRLPDDFAYTVGERTSASAAGSSVGGMSPSRSEVAAAITGTPYHRPSASSTPQPYIGSYPLVAPLPSPTPSTLGPERISQLLTWGTLLSTPRQLSSNSGGWTIKDPSRRDEIGRKLATQAGKALKDRAKGFDSAASKRRKGVGAMLPPSLTPAGGLTAGGRKTTAGMSPAARGLSERLAKASGGLTPRAKSVLSSGGRRAEVMERTAAWSGTVGSTKGGLGGRRWSESPSPVVRRPE